MHNFTEAIINGNHMFQLQSSHHHAVYVGSINGNFILVVYISMNVGPGHHGMAHPQVANGGMASNMEGSCE